MTMLSQGWCGMLLRGGLIVLFLSGPPLLRAEIEDLDTGPALPKATMDGLEEFNDSKPVKVDAKESEMELKDLLQPGSKDAAEVRAYKKKNAIYQILHGSFHKKVVDGRAQFYFDARCQAAVDLGEFIDDKRVRDLLFEYGVSKWFVENPNFIPAATASFMKSGTNEFPRLFHYLTNSPSWMIRSRMAGLLGGQRQLAPEAIDKALLNMMVNDPSEDIRGPLVKATFGKYGIGPMPDDLEQLARNVLLTEPNTLAKYVLLWQRYYPMDIAKNNTANLAFFRELLFKGKTWENRWCGLEAIRLGRQDRNPAEFPEYERDALPDVIKVLREDPNPRTRFSALDAVYVFTNAAASLALVETMEKDKDPDIRAYAGRVLGAKLNTVNKYPWMPRYPALAKTFLQKKAAEAPDASVRDKVAAAFGRALADPDPFVRYYAVMGLGKMNHPESLKLLKAFKPDAEEWINAEAAKWIRQCQAPDDTLFLGSGVGY